MSQMLKSSGAMSAATLLSRVLGLVRDICYTSFMGTTWVADAFNLAFMVPNLFRRLLGEGALSAAFIPIFKEKEKQRGEAEMWHAANAVISGLTAAAAIVVGLGIVVVSILLAVGLRPAVAMPLMHWVSTMFPWVLGVSVVGLLIGWRRGGRPAGLARFAKIVIGVSAGASLVFLVATVLLAGGLLKESGGGRTLLMLELLRIMFPYVLLVCLAAFFMGMLNARGHFFVPAMGATMLNVVMIASVLWLAPRMGMKLEEQIFGLAIGVVIAGVAQAAFQLPLLRKEGFRYRWVTPWRDETVRRTATQMIPGALGVAAYQINVLITQSMAFWVGSGVVSSFTVAVRLMELPQGVFGLSLATYLLPTLSGLAAEKKYPEFRATLRQGVGWLIFVNLLAAVLLFTLAEPMIRLLFQRAMFDEASTANSALALRCLAPGLVAFSLVNIIARAFYALGDTKTPMRISVFCLTINVAFSALLVWNYRQAGLGIANTLSALVNMSLLLYALRRKLKTLEFGGLRKDLLVLSGAALSAGAASWGLARIWGERLGHETFVMRLGEVFVPMLAASLIYLAIAATFGTGHLGELLALFRKKLRR
jgi:putative peptidoglycan lipid II flippase